MEYYAAVLALAAVGYASQNRHDETRGAHGEETKRGFSAQAQGRYWTNPNDMLSVNRGVFPHINNPEIDEAFRGLQQEYTQEDARKVGVMRMNNAAWGRPSHKMYIPDKNAAIDTTHNPMFPYGDRKLAHGNGEFHPFSNGGTRKRFGTQHYN
jgi:hypothetical protein